MWGKITANICRNNGGRAESSHLNLIEESKLQKPLKPLNKLIENFITDQFESNQSHWQFLILNKSRITRPDWPPD